MAQCPDRGKKKRGKGEGENLFCISSEWKFYLKGKRLKILDDEL